MKDEDGKRRQKVNNREQQISVVEEAQGLRDHKAKMQVNKQ